MAGRTFVATLRKVQDGHRAADLLEIRLLGLSLASQCPNSQLRSEAPVSERGVGDFCLVEWIIICSRKKHTKVLKKSCKTGLR